MKRKLKKYGFKRICSRGFRYLVNKSQLLINLDELYCRMMPCFFSQSNYIPNVFLKGGQYDFKEIENQHDLLLALEMHLTDLQKCLPKWSYDTFSKKNFPICHIQKINYQVKDDSGERFGDFMFPSELNKHRWVVLFVLAYRISGNKRYLDRLFFLLKAWRREFKMGCGVAYLLTLNVSQRLVYWVIAIQLLGNDRDAQEYILPWLSKEAYKEFLYLQAHNTFHYVIKNNFAISESVACLFFLKTFPDLPKKNALVKWRKRLQKECENQITKDGFTYEGSFVYSRFVADFLLLAHSAGETYIDPYLEKMTKIFYHFVDWQGLLPAFGDISSERGFGLGFSENMADTRSFLAIASAFLERDFFVGESSVLDFEYFMFTGSFNRSSSAEPHWRNKLYYYPDGGYSVLMRDWGKVAIDHADVGLHGTGGHGHCDIGSFCVSDRFGQIIVDPGTYLYAGDHFIRNQYRSSVFHNITRIENSEMCEFDKHLFIMHKTPSIRATAELKGKNETIEIWHEGFICDDKRVPIARNIIMGNVGFSVKDNWSGEYNVISTLHFAPSLSLRIDGVFCYIMRSESVIGRIELKSRAIWKESDYCFSPEYGLVEKAKKLLIYPGLHEGCLCYEFFFF